MFEYTTLKGHSRKLLALTGLTRKEFEALLPAFRKAYERHHPSDKTLTGQPRQRERGGGRPGVLGSMEQKLLFILVCQKTYPPQVVMGELFGMTQPGANQWIHRLLPILQAALNDLGVMPERKGSGFAQAAKESGEVADYIIDGTERRRQRPKSREKQAGFARQRQKEGTHRQESGDCEHALEAGRLHRADSSGRDTREEDGRGGAYQLPT